MTTLIPPDFNQCQAKSGGPERVRCKAKPKFLAVENHPGSDGLIGSMSLCDDCAAKLIEQMGAKYATLTPISSIKVVL